MNEVDQIKSAVSLADVVGSHEKRVCCPFHNDKHPSMDIDHQAGLWHCWSCDIGGDVFSFVMQRDRCDFRQALETLADKAGIKLGKKTPESQAAWEREQRVYRARAHAVAYYHANLLEDQGALAYLEGRGFSMDTIRRMRIGSADGSLVKSIKRKMPEGLSLEDFMAAGLIAERQGKPGTHYDYFDIRIILPLIVNGRVINLSGRATEFSNDQKQKYKHLRTDLIRNFYNEGALADTIWLFEGHTDTLTGVEMGLPAVGVIGTGGMTCPEKLKRCKTIYICGDNDGAGKKAAGNWADDILKQNPTADLQFVPLPDGFKDFNEWYLAHRGKGLQAAFDRLKDSAQGIIKYRIAQLETTDDLVKVWPLLASMDQMSRDEYFKLIKLRLPSCSMASIRGTFKTWKVEQDLKHLREASASVTDIDFKPKATKTLNVSFGFNSPATAQVCLYASVKRVNADGQEEISKEPLLIRNTIDPENPGQKPEKILLTEVPVGAERKTIPSPSVVEGRWSNESVHRFLRGDARQENTAALARDLADFFRTYIWFQNSTNFELLAFFTMGTYMARLFKVFPYLAINGLKASGKSATMTLLTQVCFNAMYAVNMTQSAMFRGIEQNFPTLFREEAEQFNKSTPENQDELCILNSGYKQGAIVYRTEKDSAGNMIQGEFDVFSPKVFAGINMLNPVLLSRSIHIKTYRAPKTVKLPKMHQEGDLIEKRGQALRDRLYTWMMQKFALIYDGFRNFPDIEGLHGREAEIWLPLLTIAYVADLENEQPPDGDKLHFYNNLLAMAIKKATEKAQTEREEAAEPKVLETILKLMDDCEILSIGYPHQEWVPLSHIAKKLTEAFRDEGYYKDTWEMNTKRLSRLLEDTRVITDRTEQIRAIKHEGKTKKCVYMPRNVLEEAIFNL